MYLQCNGCGNTITTRKRNPKRPRVCECGSKAWTKVDLATYQEYQGFHEPLDSESEDLDLKPQPMPKYQPMVNRPEGATIGLVADDMNRVATSEYNQQLFEYRQMLLDKRMANIQNNNSNNGENARVRELEKELQEMKMKEIENRSDTKFQAFQNTMTNNFEKLITQLNKGGGDPVDNMLSAFKKIIASPLGSTMSEGSPQFQLVKNQGQYQHDSMGMIGQELQAINGAGSRIADIYERQLLWQQQQQIQGNTPPGTPEPRPQPATLQELEAVTEKAVEGGIGDNSSAFLARLKSDLIKKHSDPKTPMPTESYYCAKCSYDHGRGVQHGFESHVGIEHRNDYEMKLEE